MKSAERQRGISTIVFVAIMLVVLAVSGGCVGPFGADDLGLRAISEGGLPCLFCS